MNNYKAPGAFDEDEDEEKDNNTEIINKVNTEKKIENKDESKTPKEKIKRTIYDKNSPYDNASVWAAAIFFWPIAGAILSYISLKNLWYEHAKYILIWGFIVTIIFSYILVFIMPETSNISFWFLWVIFMFFQQKKVKKWEKENPDKKHKSALKALAWGILSVVLFFITSFITIMIFTPSTDNIENNITINKEYIKEVNIGDTFNIEFSIRNIDKVNHNLKTIDFDTNFIEGILISDITPKTTTDYDEFWMHIYHFGNNINTNSETKIIFTAKAIKKWDFSWDLDFCIDTITSCIYDSIRVIVK